MILIVLQMKIYLFIYLVKKKLKKIFKKEK